MGVRDGRPMWTGRYTPDYLLPKPVELPEPDAAAIASRPHLAPDANCSNNRADELDARCRPDRGPLIPMVTANIGNIRPSRTHA